MTKAKNFTFNFTEDNENFREVPEYNHLFIKNTLNYYRDLLSARGHVFLNEVLDGFGIPRIPDGQLMGWIIPKSENIHHMVTILDGVISIKLMTDGRIDRNI